MSVINLEDTWNSGDPYEYFMGRWSKLLAPKFLQWLNIQPSKNWLDLGCGTGALSEAILQKCDPKHLTGIDPSKAFVEKAKIRLKGKANFKVGTVNDLPLDGQSKDVVVSGLALNFFNDIDLALTEMKRVVEIKGIVAAYVWDYSGRMDMLRYFWDAAFALDPGSQNLDEGKRFPICKPQELKGVFKKADFSEIECTELDVITHFRDFDDYWGPFMGAQGPAPSYLSSLSKDQQLEFKSLVKSKLPFKPDGSIKLLGRAFAIKGLSC